MIPLPYALVDRICEMAALLEDTQAEALAELLRASPDARQAARSKDHIHMLCDAELRGRADILFDTWLFLAAQTSGAEIGAALYAATVQANRFKRPPVP